MKISVIVPVYNSADTLSVLVESFLAQTFTDFELLLIDDGSTDGSADICDRFAGQDVRVKAFHKPNGGVASARKYGVEKAMGEYSIHADSDDFVEPTMLEDMYHKALSDNADIVIADYYVRNTEGKDSRIIQRPSALSAPCVLCDMLYGKLMGSLWNKMVRHSLYGRIMVPFYEGMDYMEDKLALIQLLRVPEVKVAYIDEPYYHYCLNEHSITHHISLKTYQSVLLFQEKMEQILPDETAFRNYKEEFVFAPLSLAFTYQLLPEREIRRQFLRALPQIVKFRKKRWAAAYPFVFLGLLNIARKLIII